MLVAVKSCEQHWDRCSAIRDTWAKDSDCVEFFTGNRLDVRDEYEYLPHKTQAICKWAIKHGHLHVFFCDTDTYVFLPRLKPPQSDYVGYRLEDKVYASGGAGYWLSRHAMELVLKANPSKFKNEDEMVGTILALHGVHVQHDHNYSLYHDVLPSNEIISRHLSSRSPFEICFMYAAHRRANDSGH